MSRLQLQVTGSYVGGPDPKDLPITGPVYLCTVPALHVTVTVSSDLGGVFRGLWHQDAGRDDVARFSLFDLRRNLVGSDFYHLP